MSRLRAEGYTCQTQSYALHGSHGIDCDGEQGNAPTFPMTATTRSSGVLDSCSLDLPQRPAGPCQSQAAGIVAQIFAGDPGQVRAAAARAGTNLGGKGSTTLGGVLMRASPDDGIMLRVSPAG